ncbi:MAG: hypothetical protein AAB677_00500 [Patescibacteria group bacterium]
METNNRKRYWQIFIGVLIVAIIVLVSAFRSFNQDIDSLAAVGALDGNDAPVGPTAAVELIVHDQLPGSVVFVSSVNLPSGGAVAIAENASGRAGASIGFANFGAGEQTGSIELSTPTIEGRNYFAILYHDNSNRSPISEPLYEQWLASNGQPIIVPFRATRDLPEDKG